jgi:predicted RNase H-like nuclease
MEATIIGVDCATDPRKVGLALGTWRNREATISDVRVGGRGEPLAETITGWISNDMPTLIALDAPLGWPIELGPQLVDHSAGEPLDVEANDLFRRETDRVVKEKIGRQPLDVGSNLIARTAHAALRLLDEVRTLSDCAVPLAWDSRVESVSAIEVYPAATLTAYGIQASGYKGKQDIRSREMMIEALRAHLVLPKDTSLMEEKADALDAGVCVLAAADFLDGRVVQPTDLAKAKREGWIWFCPPRP